MIPMADRITLFLDEPYVNSRGDKVFIRSAAIDLAVDDAVVVYFVADDGVHTLEVDRFLAEFHPKKATARASSFYNRVSTLWRSTSRVDLYKPKSVAKLEAGVSLDDVIDALTTAVTARIMSAAVTAVAEGLVIRPESIADVVRAGILDEKDSLLRLMECKGPRD